MAPPHVVAFPVPSQGHINPMLLLCRKLVSMGFVVTFVNTRSRHEQEFKRATPAGDDSFRFVSIPDDCLPKDVAPKGIQLFLDAVEQMKGDLETLVIKLLNDDKLPPVTAILFDGFMGWSREFCNKLEVTRLVLWTSSAACLLLHFHLSLLKPVLPVAKGRRDMIDFIPGLPAFYSYQLPDSLQVLDEHHPEFEQRIQRTDALKVDTWVFVNTFDEIETSQLAAAREVNPKCIAVGPLHYPLGEAQLTSRWTEDISCLKWLDDQAPRSVVYVSFGSAARVSYHNARQIYDGLEASGHAFLWVVRFNLFNCTEDERNELTTKIEQNERGLAIAWAPQIKVLEHESVGAFFSHCGWNSTMEAVVAGVPMLCLPCFAEQKFNTAWIVDNLKVGVRAIDDLEEEVSANHIQKMVELLLGHGSGSEIRRRAKDLSNAAKRSITPEGSSHTNLANFARALTNKHDIY